MGNYILLLTFGQTFEKKLTVVIAGGTGYLKTPVVLGLIEETE